MATKVITWHVEPPKPRELVDEQLALAHRYYNTLIELERQAAAEFADLRRRMAPGLSELEQLAQAQEEQLKHALADLAQAKSQTGKRVGPPELRQRVEQARQDLRDTRVKIKELKAALKGMPAYEHAKQAIGETHAERRRQAYAAAADLFWPTKTAVAASVEAAVAKTLGPPRFRRWSRDGSIVVQIPYGITVAEAESCTDGRIQIERTDGARWCTVRFRIGSDAKRRPIWATMRARCEMRFPPDARIMLAKLIRRANGYHRNSAGRWMPYDRWSLQFTVRYTPAPVPVSAAAEHVGTVGIDLGWRMIDDRLRVAVAYDSAQRVTEFFLPQSVVARVMKSRDIQSIRDQNFNAIRTEVAAWLKAAADALPAEMRDVVSHIHAWRSHDRLHRLAEQWQRIPGDESIYAQLQAWRERDYHLDQYARGLRGAAERRRLDYYRCIARDLARKYSTVYVEDMDIARLRRRSAPETDAPKDPSIMCWANVAAVGLLRSVLATAMARCHVLTRDTTRECHVCGIIETRTPANRYHECRCGATWDQDVNAAINIWRRGEAAGTDAAEPPDGSEPFIGRWQRRKAQKDEKARAGA